MNTFQSNLKTADARVRRGAELRAYTVRQLAERFDVSTKTISRWRKKGLIARRVVRDGRTQLEFSKPDVDRFVAEHPDLVQRGGRFSHMTDPQRSAIIQEARQLALAGRSRAEIVKQLANQLGRNCVTVREVIKRHDQKHPQNAVFPRTGLLSLDVKQAIYQQYRRGTAMASLAKQYGRSSASIERVILQMRARRLRELPMDYIPNTAFAAPTAEATILTPLPPAEHTPRKPRRPGDLPAYLASLYEVPLLTREQERHLFRKYNYLKFRASTLREQLDANRPRKRIVAAVEQLYDQAVATKKRLVQANLRLVVSIAKRYLSDGDNLFDLISDGNVSLMRAVEKFDYALGNKFSTYASWAIKNNFARDRATQLRRRDHFRSGHEEVLASQPEIRGNVYQMETDQRQYEAQVGRILTELDDRERLIIAKRFGLDRSEEAQTLKQVGDQLGVSKERIRQIEARAMEKLRQAVTEARFDRPE